MNTLYVKFTIFYKIITSIVIVDEEYEFFFNANQKYGKKYQKRARYLQWFVALSYGFYVIKVITFFTLRVRRQRRFFMVRIQTRILRLFPASCITSKFIAGITILTAT